MALKRNPQTAVAAAVSKVPILSVFILKDDGRFMASNRSRGRPALKPAKNGLFKGFAYWMQTFWMG